MHGRFPDPTLFANSFGPYYRLHEALMTLVLVKGEATILISYIYRISDWLPNKCVKLYIARLRLLINA